MPRVSPARRFCLHVIAAGLLGVVLLWGCWLVLGAGIGTHICAHYTYVVGGENPQLDAWCNGRSWQNWLGVCLMAAAILFAGGWALAVATGRLLCLLLGAVLAGACVWSGLALPQTLAGPDQLSQLALVVLPVAGWRSRACRR